MKIYILWLTICFLGALITGIFGNKKNQGGAHFTFWIVAPLFLLFGIIFFWKRKKDFIIWWVKELFNVGE